MHPFSALLIQPPTGCYNVQMGVILAVSAMGLQYYYIPAFHPLLRYTTKKIV